jgi:ribosome-binding protein aMBF1 (putative translation factor)
MPARGEECAFKDRRRCTISQSLPLCRSVGELISTARHQQWLSFGDLARRLGAWTPRQTSALSQRLVKVERERSVVERRLIFRLAEVLGANANMTSFVEIDGGRIVFEGQ